MAQFKKTRLQLKKKKEKNKEMEISPTVATVVHACWFVRHVCSSQVDSQHEVHLLHGRFQSSRQVDGAGVVHQDVDAW